MEESKFDKMQRFFFNALDRMGEDFEILEMGCHPNNFYLKVGIEGKEYELSEVENEEMNEGIDDSVSWQTDERIEDGREPYKFSELDKETAIAIAQRVSRNSVRY